MEKLTYSQIALKDFLERTCNDYVAPDLKRAFKEPDLIIKGYYIFPEGCYYTRSYYHKFYANENIISSNFPYKLEVYRIVENSKTIWEELK
jgi:hypothetical protein